MDYELGLNQNRGADGNITSITATLGERLTDGLKNQTGAIAQSALAGVTLVNTGSDRILRWLPPEDDWDNEGSDEKSDIEAQDMEPTNEFRVFSNMDFSSLRTKTGNHGSYVDSKTGGIDLGWAKALESQSGKLVFAPVVDYGTGNYDSYMRDGNRWIHGHGDTTYMAGGMIARKMLRNGFYYEGSFRYGRVKSDFTSNDFMMGDSPTNVSYDTSTPVYSGHIHLGKFFKLSNESTMQVYWHYFHNHQAGMSAHLSTGEKYDFDALDSGRFRTGFHITRQPNKHSRFYMGMAYQYEFSDDSRASYRGLSTPKSRIKGSSGMIEMGWQYKPSEKVPWMVDAGLVGWAGHQKGVTFQVKLKKSF